MLYMYIYLRENILYVMREKFIC